jgi:phospholipid/cholesterol/gamma-HCH transport system substrate-binding protein
MTKTFDNANAAIDALTPTIAQANDAVGAIADLIENDFAPLAGNLRTTLENADGALVSADQAFARADSLMATDLGPALSETREALSAMADTVAAVTVDIPVIMSDLRAGVAEARRAIATVSPGLRDFNLLGGEARALIRTLNDLARRISQNPSGFILDNRVPEYRR